VELSQRPSRTQSPAAAECLPGWGLGAREPYSRAPGLRHRKPAAAGVIGTSMARYTQSRETAVSTIAFPVGLLPSVRKCERRDVAPEHFRQSNLRLLRVKWPAPRSGGPRGGRARPSTSQSDLAVTRSTKSISPEERCQTRSSISHGRTVATGMKRSSNVRVASELGKLGRMHP